MSDTHYQQLSIIGLGLIGGSLAMAARKAGLAQTITAFDSNPLTLEYALNEGIIDAAGVSLEDAIADADVIILASPPSTIADSATALAPILPDTALLMDTASVKMSVRNAVREALGEQAFFMPCHPIAGAAHSGIRAAKADLFAGKRCILTPENIENPAIEPASAFWRTLGMTVEYMPPDLHDQVYAIVSHLPQLLAFGVGQVLGDAIENSQDAVFKQFTRLCGSDRHLWDDIFRSNQPYLDQALAQYMVIFAQLREELVAAKEAENSPQLSDEQVRTELLPRIIASSLVAMVMQQEQAMGFSLGHFAGTGFADFTAPATQHPENQLEIIAHAAPQLVHQMDLFLDALSHWIVIKH